MPTPTRPSTGGPVESSWGQEVHDQVFIPAGGIYNQGAAIFPNAYVTFTASTDPGGFLPAPGPNITVPADGAGTYLIDARYAITAASVAGNATAEICVGTVPSGLTQTVYALVSGVQYVVLSGYLELLVGGQVELFYASGPASSVLQSAQLRLIRLARGYGLA